MSRLVVNPGTPQCWEIQLKPGINSIGRSEQNDFQISDASISGSHCQIIVQDGTASIKDLGSTNGTYLNRSRIEQATLLDGQNLRLGGVELVFCADGTTSAALPPSLPAAIQPPGIITPAAPARIHVNTAPSAPAAPTGLRIAGSAAKTAEHPAPEESAAPSMPPLEIPSGPSFCKFHPRSPARFFCNKCRRSFCDLCVSSRVTAGATIKTCRSCGVECVPVQAQRGGPSAERGFFGQLPGAFIYPFKGSGLLILIVATIVFAGLSFISVGWLSILMKMAAVGYLFSYMQNIIHATAAEERELPELPDFDGLFGAFFTLAGTVLMSFGIAIGLAAAKFLGDVEAIPTSAIIVATVFGCLYFPMAFLATAMKDTALASNPLIVIPAVIKVPVEYIVTVILMTGIFGVQKIGDIVSSGAGSVSLSTRSMSVMFAAFGFQIVWSFISLYLLTINMRILGLLYITKKNKLEWF